MHRLQGNRSHTTEVEQGQGAILVASLSYTIEQMAVGVFRRADTTQTPCRHIVQLHQVTLQLSLSFTWKRVLHANRCSGGPAAQPLEAEMWWGNASDSGPWELPEKYKHICQKYLEMGYWRKSWGKNIMSHSQLTLQVKEMKSKHPERDISQNIVKVSDVLV